MWAGGVEEAGETHRQFAVVTLLHFVNKLTARLLTMTEKWYSFSDCEIQQAVECLRIFWCVYIPGDKLMEVISPPSSA